LPSKRGPAQPKKRAQLPKKNDAVAAAAASNPEAAAAAVPTSSEGSESRFLLDKDFRYPLLKVIIAACIVGVIIFGYFGQNIELLWKKV
jgi:hypothetical protein